jgi:hypothetical protein
MTIYVFQADAWARLAAAEELRDPGTTSILEPLGVGDGWRCLEHLDFERQRTQEDALRREGERLAKERQRQRARTRRWRSAFATRCGNAVVARCRNRH